MAFVILHIELRPCDEAAIEIAQIRLLDNGAIDRESFGSLVNTPKS